MSSIDMTCPPYAVTESPPIPCGADNVEWRRKALHEFEAEVGRWLPPGTKHIVSPHFDLKVHPFAVDCAHQCLEKLHLLSSELGPDMASEISSTLDTLSSSISKWRVWTTIQAVARIQSVKDTLQATFEVVLRIEKGNPSINGNSSSNFMEHAMRIDVIYLERVIAETLGNGQTFMHAILRLSDSEKYGIMDIFQKLVDDCCSHKRLIERYLKKIVRETGLVPRSLFLLGIQRLGANPIAGGGFADVWKGHLQGQPVALKVLRLFGHSASKLEGIHTDFCKEAMMWRQFCHPNVLPFLGVCKDVFDPQLAMVSPWMDNGNVLSHLERHPTVDRLEIILEIGSGLQYLHVLEPLIVHGDLRAANILVDKHGTARVADFGLARVVDSQTTVAGTSFDGKGCMRWQAPELLVSSRFRGVPSGITTASDVYAFACVCLEVFTGKVPFENLKDGEVILEVAIRESKPSKPLDVDPSRGLTDDVWGIMRQCWAFHPSSRPSIEDINKQLRFGVNKIRFPALELVRAYVNASDRLAHGERTLFVMSGRVVQKSYGPEKDFLIPPLLMVMFGNSWWPTETMGTPRILTQISGEGEPRACIVECESVSGEPVDAICPPSDTTYIWRCVDRSPVTSISRKSRLEAVVKISLSPQAYGDSEHVVGTFPSAPIEVINSIQKRQFLKSVDPNIVIGHGSTICVLRRPQEQLASTNYLCVSGSDSFLRGSDGRRLMTHGRQAQYKIESARWDPFIIYIIDADSMTTDAKSPPYNGYPPSPQNVIPLASDDSLIAVRYNQIIVLQCLKSGFVSPPLIIRKIIQGTIVVGGGAMVGDTEAVNICCPPGEVCGDPVSHFDEIAFELYDAKTALPDPGVPGKNSVYLICEGEGVDTEFPKDNRHWIATLDNNNPGPSNSPPKRHNYRYNRDNAGRQWREGGGGMGERTFSTAFSKQHRRLSSSGDSSNRRESATLYASSGATWFVNVPENGIWSAVGTEQIRYDFFVPLAQQGTTEKPSPVTPFPRVFRYHLPSIDFDAAKDNVDYREPGQLTLEGENFSETDPFAVYFGAEPSPHVEVQSTCVIKCLPPKNDSAERRPILLVRSDGIIFPTNVLYPS